MCEQRERYIAAPSAKSFTLDLTCSGRSFMYAGKKIGSRTKPCRTQEDQEHTGYPETTNAIEINKLC